MPSKKENLNKLINTAFQTLKNDNVEMVELRSSIIYLTLLLNESLENIMEILISNLAESSSKYGIKFGLIMTISRDNNCLIYLKNLMKSYENIGCPKEIIGLDLAGNEDFSIPGDVSYLFRLYKNRHNLKITIHAGETGNKQNIIEAIDDFCADRIGHGTAAGSCPEIMEVLANKNICVEICPISNRRTGAVGANESHPAKEFIKHGVPFVICSDNPGIHKNSLSDDYYDFYKETNNMYIIDKMYERQKEFSFIS